MEESSVAGASSKTSVWRVVRQGGLRVSSRRRRTAPVDGDARGMEASARGFARTFASSCHSGCLSFWTMHTTPPLVTCRVGGRRGDGRVSVGVRHRSEAGERAGEAPRRATGGAVTGGGCVANAAHGCPRDGVRFSRDVSRAPAAFSSSRATRRDVAGRPRGRASLSKSHVCRESSATHLAHPGPREATVTGRRDLGRQADVGDGSHLVGCGYSGVSCRRASVNVASRRTRSSLMFFVGAARLARPHAIFGAYTSVTTRAKRLPASRVSSLLSPLTPSVALPADPNDRDPATEPRRDRRHRRGVLREATPARARRRRGDAVAEPPPRTSSAPAARPAPVARRLRGEGAATINANTTSSTKRATCARSTVVTKAPPSAPRRAPARRTSARAIANLGDATIVFCCSPPARAPTPTPRATEPHARPGCTTDLRPRRHGT